ncbi:MAG: methyl-accepting chemotaxis protein, partial [Alphaproteobacteria bacterium]|nr:methyl-accepting chemotaxis protein [Alphaproteobacteria bacterium]
IEAARAGEAGKGFAVVACEVKSLAMQTADATKDIAAQISDIQQVTAQVVDTIASIGSSISEVEGFAEEVSHAIGEQMEAAREIGGNAQQAAHSTREVTSMIAEVSQEIQMVETIGENQRQQSQVVHDLVAQLHGRLKVALNETDVKGLDVATRLPFELRASLIQNNNTHVVGLRSLTRQAANIAGDHSPGRQEGMCEIELMPELRLHAEIRERAEAAGKFELLFTDKEVQNKVQALMASENIMDQPYIHRASEAAEHISKAMETALSSGRISESDLFDTDYKAVEGSNPEQHETKYNDLLDELLPQYQEPVLTFDDRVIFCAAVDMNGYLPTHNLKYNNKQRTDDPVWNAGNCRNRRIFNDRTGTLAGANREAYLVQSYLRDMGGGNFVLMKDLVVPIKVNGRQWGNLRLGYKPK